MASRKLKPYSRWWEHLADRLARDFAPRIFPCGKCDHPVAEGYCCTFCGDPNPQEKERGHGLLR